MKGLSVLNQLEKTIMIAGEDGIVSSFDMQTHHTIDVWAVGCEVTALATLSLEEGGFIVAACTSKGDLIIRQDWEELAPRKHECGHKTINDVKFSNNGSMIVCASQDKHIYLLQLQEGEYVKLAGARLENGVPNAINFSEDSKRILIITHLRKLILFDPIKLTMLYKVEEEELSSQFWSSFVGSYSLITKSISSTKIPIILGNVSNMVVTGDEHGNIFMFKDVESVKENIGINMSGHTSPVQRIEFTKDDKNIVSLGAYDEAVF
jgi:WD40 repeat protein